LLAKGWGVTTHYFCGPERIDLAEEVLADGL
jgi:hypothetical protein